LRLHGDLKEAGGKLVNDALNPIRNSLADSLVGATAGATAKFEEMRKEFARTGKHHFLLRFGCRILANSLNQMMPM